MDAKERDAIEGYGEFHAHEAPTPEVPQHVRQMRLTLAAPDLLEACRYALGWLNEGDPEDYFGLQSAIRLCQEAIAKAEG